MRRIVLAQLRARPGRTLALLVGIVAATASFTVLTGASETGRLRVRGTVARDFRTSYDILVRPRGSRGTLERREGLVRPGALSGIAGGITLAQWRTVERQPGVDVAAPIAIVGYAFANVGLPIDLTDELRTRRSALFRVDVEEITDRGLTRQADAPLFAYLTRRSLLPEPAPSSPRVVMAPRVRAADGTPRPICADGYTELATSGPFDPAARGGERGALDCSSLRTGRFGDGFAPLARRRVGAVVQARVPFVIAGIDPDEEARLTGLPEAMISGRALRAADRPSDDFVPRVPVVVAGRPYFDQTLRVRVRAMPARTVHGIDVGTTPGRTAAALRVAPGPVLRRTDFSATATYGRFLDQLAGRAGYAPVVTAYWATGPTSYDAVEGGALRPRVVGNPANVWSSQADFGGFVRPPLAARDLGFRRLAASGGATSAQLGEVYAAVRSVGRFDPARLATGDRRVDVALGTLVPSGLAPVDARSRRALGGRPLLANGNLAGYATQAPLMLTNLRSLGAFAGANYTPNHGAAPISAIRVRVANVHGIDAASRARVRQTAQAIGRTTGLDVDLTVGASVSPKTIALPAGRFGRPELRVREDWVRKGVALTVLAAVDRKSLALFVLILAVCAVFVANATSAAVAARRTELAVLACVGWPPARLMALVVGEVVLVGATAGVLGGAIALLATGPLDVTRSLARAAIAIPAGIALCAAAALVPALRASRSRPITALVPAVRAPRRRLRAARTRRPRGIAGLAALNLLRTPGRNGLAVVSLAAGIAAVTLLLSITLAFRGAVVGSLLGSAVAVEVRTVDYLAAAITLALGALSVADVLYINLRERAAELAVLRATGWGERDVARMVAVEGALLGAAAGLVGGVAGLSLGWLVEGTLAGGALLAAALGAVGGTLLVAVVSMVPAHLAGRRAITAELSVE